MHCKTLNQWWLLEVQKYSADEHGFPQEKLYVYLSTDLL